MMASFENSNRVRVKFTVNGETEWSGAFPADDVVHLALHHLLPSEIRNNRRLSVTKGSDLIYPDMFLYEIVEHYGDADFDVTATALDVKQATAFANYGFDHLALAVEDRNAARRFFAEGLRMEVVRDDAHLTVVTTGNTAVFLFDFDPEAPLAPPQPSQIHHLGFVVDDLSAAATHLREQFPEFLADYTLLERQERWSLYGHVSFGAVKFLIQLSEIKDAFQGLTTRNATAAQHLLYDYASRDYGVRLG